jgi:hypothetical protein
LVEGWAVGVPPILIRLDNHFKRVGLHIHTINSIGVGPRSVWSPLAGDSISYNHPISRAIRAASVRFAAPNLLIASNK